MFVDVMTISEQPKQELMEKWVNTFGGFTLINKSLYLLKESSNIKSPNKIIFAYEIREDGSSINLTQTQITTAIHQMGVEFHRFYFGLGGYKDNEGNPVIENSCLIDMTGHDDITIAVMAERIREFLKQQSVLLIDSSNQAHFVVS